MRVKLLLIFLFVSFITNAQINTIAEDLPNPSWENINYAGNNHIYNQMDIYVPRNDQKSHPVVMTIYGSAWRKNDQKASNYIKKILIQPLLESGFAVVSINHRSSFDAKFPAQIHDVKAALRFVRANESKYSLNTDFIGVTGSSSGGHLAAMAGTTSFVDKMEGKVGKFLNYSSHVDAVVNWFGPTDFLIMDSCGSRIVHDNADSPESLLVGGAIQKNLSKVKSANPLTYITKKTPPFLVIHGMLDKLVPYCQSEVLHNALKSKNRESKLVLIEDGKHGPEVFTEKYISLMSAFFKNQLNSN